MVNIRTEVAYGNVAYQSSKGQEGHFEDFLPLDDEEMDKYPESPVFRWVGIPTYTDLEVIAEECDTSPRAVLDMSAWTSKFDDEVSNIPQLPKPCLLIETSACSSSDIPVYLKRALRSGCSHASSINR